GFDGQVDVFKQQRAADAEVDALELEEGHGPILPGSAAGARKGRVGIRIFAHGTGGVRGWRRRFNSTAAVRRCPGAAGSAQDVRGLDASPETAPSWVAAEAAPTEGG